METGRPAVREAASWFAAHGDKVYLGVPAVPQLRDENAEYLVFDPLVPESLAAAVKTVEAADGRLDIFVAGAAAHPQDGEMESSNSWSTGRADLAYHASLAGLNMMGKILFNRLRPEGFTFRWYCDDGAPGGMCAAEYIVSGLCYDEKEPYIHSDENRLVLRDAYLREISW